MKRIISYIATAIVPVLLAWVLGYAKIPESVDLIDYSSSGAELINSTETITSTLKIEANGRNVQKLSIYNLRFANKSNKNLQKVQVEFRANGENSELIASTIKGPKNYSETLINKLSESKSGATYQLEFINVSDMNPGEYFTASFLFSGEPPISIDPVALSPGIGFANTKGNSKAEYVVASIFILALAIYAYFLWMIDTYNSKRHAIKEEEYQNELSTFIHQRFSLSYDDSKECTKEITQLRVNIFKPDNRIKSFLKKLLV